MGIVGWGVLGVFGIHEAWWGGHGGWSKVGVEYGEVENNVVSIAWWCFNIAVVHMYILGKIGHLCCCEA